MIESGGGPVIVIHLMGGLGNQLFQYAFGRRLALANSAELVLDASGYGSPITPDPLLGVREFGLDHFHMQGSVFTGRENGAVGGIPWRRWSSKARRAMRRVLDLGKPYYLRTEIVEPPQQRFKYDSRLRSLKVDRKLFFRGYWQSERYFLDAEATIRRELMVRGVPQGQNAKLASEIRGARAVAIHVRHGDNAGAVAAELGVLPRQYYEGALDVIRKNVRDSHFYVFSDDPQWSRQMLGHADQFTFVDHNDARACHEDMRLMMMCSHHILGNSTFGWWGAWLARHPGQIVVAPRRYYQNTDWPNPDLYPRDWKLL